MLSKLNYLIKIIFSTCLLLGITGLANSANAQFIGISADVAIAYSAAPGNTSGYSIGISHPAPFFPNIGFSNVSFNDTESISDSSDSTSSVSLDTTTTIKTINLFYNVPFPVITIALGFGYGSENLLTGVESKTTIIETFQGNELEQDNSDLEVSVSEAFVHFGLPFWNMIEFHIGYHYMSFTNLDATSNKNVNFQGNYTIEKKSYSGGMTTIGVQIAF